MKQLHRLVISAFIGPFAMSFFMVMFVLILQFLWLQIDDLVGKGLAWSVILELLLYASGSLFVMGLPLIVLLSSIMAVGNLGEHNELLALKAAGISLPRILSSLIVVASLVTVGDFFFSNNALPYINLKLTSLMFDVKQQRPELQIKEGVFYDGINNYNIRVDDKDEETGLLHGIIIYDHSKGNGNRSVTIADSGHLRMTSNQKYLVLQLYDGHTYEEENESSGGERKLPFRTNKFAEQEVIFELTGYGFERTDENLFKGRASMLNLNQLSVMSDSLARERDSRTAMQIRSFLYSNNFSHHSDFDNSSSKPYKIYADSIVKTLNAEQRLATADKALVQAKQAQSSLGIQADDLRRSNATLNMHNIEWHLKFSYPIACFIFFLIGAPLGAIIRKGGFGTPFIISLIVFLIYYMVSVAFKKMARDGAWDVAVAMWMSTLVTLPMGIFLTYKAVTDQRFALPKWYTKASAWMGKFFSK